MNEKAETSLMSRLFLLNCTVLNVLCGLIIEAALQKRHRHQLGWTPLEQQ